MSRKWPKTVSMRSRIEEKPGQRLEWPVLQVEVPIQWILEYAQEQLGLHSVAYHEITAEVGFQDPKTRVQLQGMLARALPTNKIPIQTKLAPGSIEDVPHAVDTLLKKAEAYLRDGICFQAAVMVYRAQRALNQAGEFEG
ncbi:MAG: hypothetical protein HQL13_08640, partial [Candidatus Omnitrophica bacterium]|nr:hypothetical protein [Candidatus Omnitrophota bacterium]